MENHLITKKHKITPFSKPRVRSSDCWWLLTWPSYYFYQTVILCISTCHVSINSPLNRRSQLFVGKRTLISFTCSDVFWLHSW